MPVDKATAWLSDWVGVTPEQPDTPISLGPYDNQGCFALPSTTTNSNSGSSSSSDSCVFATFPRWADSIEPHRTRHDELCGPAGQCDCHLHGAERQHATGCSCQQCQKGGDPTAACPAKAPAPGLHFYKPQHRQGRESWVRYGVAFHRACGQLLQQRLGYSLNFNHIWPLLQQQQQQQQRFANHLTEHEYSYSSYSSRDYRGPIHQVWQGETSFEYRGITPRNMHLLLDPLECSHNAEKIWIKWQPLICQFTGESPYPSAATTCAAAGAALAAPDYTAGAAIEGGTGASSSKSSTHRGDAAAVSGSTGPHGRYDRSLTILPLLVSHASSKRQQLRLTAQLLPLCSTMPQLLRGSLQLKTAVSTAAQAAERAAWLDKYGSLVHTLDLHAVVNCCNRDAGVATSTLAAAVKRAHTDQALQLTSFTGYLPARHTETGVDFPEQLLTTLPLQHLAALHLSGSWDLSAGAAAALAACTALRELAIPGAGLAGGLGAAPSSPAAANAAVATADAATLGNVLAATLRRLDLTDAGDCSAEDLTTLAQQLSGLTHLGLAYHPSDCFLFTQSPAALKGPENHGDTKSIEIVQDVQQCWTGLPVRSLQLGPKHMPFLEWPESPGEAPPLLAVDHTLMGNIAALTGLTSLSIGPSARLVGEDYADTGLEVLLGSLWGPKALQELTGLRQLTLTPQVWVDAYGRSEVDSQAEEILSDTAELPHLQDLVLCQLTAGDSLDQLEAAQCLTRLELVGWSPPQADLLLQKIPGLVIERTRGQMWF